VRDGKNEVGDCDEVMLADELNQKESDRLY